jgi:P-type Mg2+ transporter
VAGWVYSSILLQRMKVVSPFWHSNPTVLFEQLATNPGGLTATEAARRLCIAQNTKMRRPAWVDTALLFLAQFKNPIVLILVFAVALSAALGETTNAILIFSILMLTGILRWCTR